MNCTNKKCEYEWDYKGKAKFYATCPSCLRKSKIVRQDENLNK